MGYNQRYITHKSLQDFMTVKKKRQNENNGWYIITAIALDVTAFLHPFVFSIAVFIGILVSVCTVEKKRMQDNLYSPSN